MTFGFIETLTLIGALGFFIYGMKIMSEGIQKAAGSSLRRILSVMTSTRFLGVGTGFLITCLIQSSSATTVMVVSFVNAGLLSLTESIGVIMGANIGTTLTGWLVSLFGFKFKIASFSLPILAIGFPMIFSNRDKLKSWGEFIIGFALLFMGLDALKQAVPDIKSNPSAVAFIADFADMGVLSTLIFVLIGTLLTVVVQSSSAAMAITLVLCNQGVISLEIAAAIVLGENIGTTITANVAALVANIHAKRAAVAHLIFNLFGVIWVVILFKPFLDLIEILWVPFHNLLKSINPEFVNGETEMQLSLFHTIFNITNSLLLIWFVNLIAKIVVKLVPSKGDADELYQLEYISSGIMSTPEIALLEAKKEVLKFGNLIKKMNKNVKLLLTEQDKKKVKYLLEKVKSHEDITDNLEAGVADYLAKISESEMSNASSIRVRGMLSIVGDLERMGDIYYQMSKAIERKISEKIWFTPEQRQNLLKMFDLLDLCLTTMVENLAKESGEVEINDALDKERELNSFRKKIRKEHFKNVEKGEYNFRSANVYSDLFNSIEKVGDHAINVTEGIIGEV
ncbi:MAG: Na/Pi cotransporter family protein [Vicingaceae bacterium]|nr:Na/Pi cotransporter family protein [Vicingaceae bacterium]